MSDKDTGLAHGLVQRFSAGDVIFRQGDSGREMYIVQSGDVQLLQNGHPLETVELGNIFGEMEFVNGAERHVTAVAMTDVEVVPVTEAQFVHMVEATPNFALLVMRVMSERWRDRNERTVRPVQHIS
jgi:CRP-like cAMP-binding protein